MNLDRLLKLGQIVALVIVPIWLLSELTSANKMLSLRMDQISAVQTAQTETLRGIDARLLLEERATAINEGIKIGMERAERERRRVESQQ